MPPVRESRIGGGDGSAGDASRAGGGPKRGKRQAADAGESNVKSKRVKNGKAPNEKPDSSAATSSASQRKLPKVRPGQPPLIVPVPQRNFSYFDFSRHLEQIELVSHLTGPSPDTSESRMANSYAGRDRGRGNKAVKAGMEHTQSNDSERGLVRNRVKQHTGSKVPGNTQVGIQNKTPDKTPKKTQRKTQNETSVNTPKHAQGKASNAAVDETQSNPVIPVDVTPESNASDTAPVSSFTLKTKPKLLSIRQRETLRAERIKQQSVNMKSIFSSSNPDDYIFFCLPEKQYGWLGNHYYSTFKLLLDDKDGELFFKTAAHYILYRKCRLFPGNKELSVQLLDLSLKRATEWGRTRIENFDEYKWKKNRMSILGDSLIQKFTSPTWHRYKLALLATGNKTIVAAIKGDSVWGIGVSEKKARSELHNRQDWGQNLLGISLMLLRDELKKKADTKEEDTKVEAKKLWDKLAKDLPN
ncbi:hypothetical protein F4859DRAFT_517441 [Xylaria cf. heliscus]|nr:hypothetical protein F4859DRAFT_517441 [Xylaria cf. heliscus]